MPNRTLTVGTFGDEVRDLHLSLRQLGFELPAAEVERAFFGPATREAVREYQRGHSLRVTGEVDSATRTSLESGAASRSPRPTPAQPLVPGTSTTSRADAARAFPGSQPTLGRAARPEDQIPAEGQLIVRGHVVYKDGLLIEGVTVRAYNRDLRHEDFLGEAVTDQEGRYEIRYSAQQFSRADKQYADLLLRVFDLRPNAPSADQDKAIAESAIIFGAQPVEKVKLTVDGGIRNAWSEYEQILDEVRPLLGDREMTSLTEDADNQDITFLAGQANQDPHNIARMVWAHRQAAATGLAPQVFYGFARQGLPLTLPELLAQSPEVQRTALEGAVYNHIIPGTVLDQMDAILKRLRELVVEQAFAAPRDEGRESLSALLSTVVADKAVQAKFLSTYLTHAGPMKAFWDQVGAQPELKGKVQALQLAIQLAAVTGNNVRLVQEIQRNEAAAGVTSARDLARLGVSDWQKLIEATATDGKVSVPPEVEGKNDAEKTRNYAMTMTRMIADAFPTEVIAHRLQKDEARAGSDLNTFMGNIVKADTGFEVRQASIGKFLADNPETLKGIANVPVLETQLKAVQRVARLAPQAEHVKPLLDLQLHSASAITRLGEPAFLAKVVGHLDETTARRIYARAEYTAAAALHLFTSFNPTLESVGLHVLPPKRTSIDGVPDWETLFGSVDLCACEECGSVHGPAAYLVELLAWLNERKSRTEGVSARDVMFRRRPDLGDISLNCDNTQTSMPYIDLVNEVLESAVAPFVPFDLAPTLVGDLVPGPLSDALRAGLALHGIDLTADATVVNGPAGTWFVTDGAVLHGLRSADGRLQVVTRCAQTSRPAADLLASPEHVNVAAYDALRDAVFPLELPFDAWMAQGRAFLGQLKVRRHELMTTLHPRGGEAALVDTAIAAEYLELTPLAWQLIAETAEPRRDTWTLWGLQEAGNEVRDIKDSTATVTVGWRDALRRVRVLLDRARIEYADLLELLETRFVNPTGTLEIVSGDPDDPATCDTSRLVIAGLDELGFDLAMRRLTRFLRLKRALEWTIPDLDVAIVALQHETAPVDARLSEAALLELSHLERLRESLGVPVERLAALWGPIDTNGANSLYERLFLNPAVLKPIDPAFNLANGELAIVIDAPDEAKISKHGPALEAALGLNEQDVAALASTDAADDALTLANLSQLFRIAVLATSLGLRVAEVQLLRDLTGINPFNAAHTEDTLRFVDAVSRLEASGFTAADLAYLLQHRTSAQSGPSEGDDAIAALLEDIRSGLQRIAADYDARADTTGDFTRKHLATLKWNPLLVEQVVAMLKDALSVTTPLAALPDIMNGLSDHLPSRLSYDAQSQRLAFAGVMTIGDQTALLSASAEAAYQAAVRALFRMPRDLVTEKMKAFDLPVFSTPLDQLPTGLAFPPTLRSRVYFDAHATEGSVPRPQLRFRGMMFETERDVLLALSSDTAYQAAVNVLFQAPASYVPESSNAFLTAADAAWMFDSPRTADERFGRVLDRLLPTLRDRMSAGLIKQKLAEALRLDAARVDRLATQHLRSVTDPAKAVLADFLEPAFAGSSQALAASRTAFGAQYDAFVRFAKAAAIVSRLKLTVGQLGWLRDYGVQASWLDLNALPLVASTSAELFKPWSRLAALADARDGIPGREATVTDVLTVAGGDSSSASAVLDHLSVLTGWDRDDLETLSTRLQASHGAALVPLTQLAAYRGEAAILRLVDACRLLKRLGVSATRAISWAGPTVSYGAASDMLRAVKAKYDETEWTGVARPIRDTLREAQRDALVGYLVTRPAPDATGPIRWREADDLYQYFLIDVSMTSCMMTSRIRQALSSIQLFVQRCLLNLEPDVKADENADRRWRDWTWMKNYRVWQANRLVFLYPENWIEPELRDDKSPFFKELENELLQNEVTQDTAEEAFLHYLEKLDVVARLEVVGMYHHQEESTDVLHVFGRTRHAPHLYFYRQRLASGRWTAWEKVDIDIEGDHLIPVIWNRRLYLIWPIFSAKADPPPQPPPQQTAENQVVSEPQKHWEIQLAWSEYKRRKWLPKQITTTRMVTDDHIDEANPDATRLRYMFYAVPDGEGLSVFAFYSYQITYPYPYFAPVIRSGWKGGEFRFTGCGGEVFFRSAWTRTMFTERGTTPLAMHFVEQGSSALYLPKTPTTAENGVAFRATPGQVPFSVLYPHQDVTLTGGRPFFFEDETKTFFVVPEEATVVTQMWKRPELVHPALIDAVRVRYYLEPKLIAEGLPAVPAHMAMAGALAAVRATGGSLGPADKGLSIVSREVKSIINPKWSLPAPVISVTRRERRYRFYTFFHPYQCLFIRRLNRDGLDGFLVRDLQLTHADTFASRYGPTELVVKTDAQGRPAYPVDDVDFSYTGAFSQYNWEIFCHAVILIARKLTQNQRFEEAQRWLHYVFDPTDISSVDVPQKYWKMRPFYETSSDDYQRQQIENILERLASETPVPEFEQQVSEWRDNPFNPHLIARLRTTAYQKNIVMKYLDNVLAAADYKFQREPTKIESRNEAAELYVYAASILGRRPVIIPRRSKTSVQTYNSLDPKLSDFSDRLVQAENLVATPPPDTPGPPVDDRRPPLTWPPVPYFCVTPNDKLLKYWDIVSDRLGKLRRCQNIEGVVQHIPLFDPPIDPALLVRAAAAGIDIGSVLSDVDAPLAPYRFNVLVQKAGELCSEVKALGQALLTALEKRDAEEMAQLRSTQEIALLNKVKEVRLKQKDDAAAGLEAVKRTKKVTEARRNYYRDIEERIEEERQHLSNLETAVVFQTIGQGIEILAGVLALIPQFKVGVSGAFGSPVITAEAGGSQLNTAVQVASRSMQLMSAIYNYMANKASIEAGFKRRWTDWKQQESLAILELDQLEKQIEGADIRLQIADQEVKHQELQIENAAAVDEFLRTKFTNRDLYDWMIGQISALYFQSYQIAYDMAKRAERAYRYELGLDESAFINFGHWDSLRRGLLAGDALYHDVKRLEFAFLDQNRREHEITKLVSLSLLDPLALLKLRETGTCFVDLPESLFDVDYPGHYMRRLRSVSLTIPCVTGPYTGVQCTLTMLRNTVRRTSTLRAGKYARAVDVEDSRFRDGVGATQSMATSSAQNDSGLFELTLRDERYLPFEGAGVVSSWRISLGTKFRSFDYDTISDVILHLRYTARDGGDALKVQVEQELDEAVNQMGLAEGRRGLFRWFSLKHEFPSEWQHFLRAPDAATGDRVQTFPLTSDRFPYLFRGRRLRIVAAHALALTTDAVDALDLYLTPTGATPSDTADKISLAPDPNFGVLLHQRKAYKNQEREPGERWRLRLKPNDLPDAETILDDVTIVFEYRADSA